MKRFRRTRLMGDALERRETPATLSSFLTNQHVDINTVYVAANPSPWNIQPRDDDAGGVSYEPDVALLYVGKGASTSRPGGSEFDFIGVSAGANYFRLPASQDPNLLYLGAAGYGIDSGAFDRYNPSTESRSRVSGLGRWSKISLVEVKHVTPTGTTGNGIFSVSQSGDTGPVVFMSNFNDNVANPNSNGLDATDGISVDDAYWVLTGGHTHYNWNFSEPGRYEIGLKASGYADDGNTTSLGSLLQSPTITLFFSVGSVGTVNVSTTAVSVDESAGTAKVTLTRTGGSDGQMTFNYATTDGSAKAGQDYASSSGTVTFNDGETTASITIPITDDTTEEAAETFTLTLSSPGPNSIADYRANVEGQPLLGATTKATITINANDVSGPNTPPTISSIANKTTTEDTATSVIFTVGDAQTPLDQLQIVATSSNAAVVPNGGLVLSGTGANRTLSLTPVLNASGSADVTVTVTDSGSATATSKFTFTVTPVPDQPSVTSATTLVDTQTTSGLVISANPVDGGSITHFRINGITNGSLFQNNGTTAITNGQFITLAQGSAGLRFTPAAGLTSPASTFQFTAQAATSAATAGGPTTTATITVNAMQLPPLTATDDSFTVTPQNSLRGNVLGNDTVDSTANVTSLTVSMQPTTGTVQLATDGSFTYTPGSSFATTDSFTYELVDSFGSKATAKVSIAARSATLPFGNVFSEGDVDVGIAYEDNAFEPHIHDEEAAIEVEPDAGLFHVRGIAATPRPASSTFDFLGVAANETYWRLSQSPVGELLYLGFGSEEIANGVFAKDQLTMRVVAVDGPGQVSIWNNTDTGPDVFVASSNGLTSTDRVQLQTASHTHFNWGFSLKGRYAITVEFDGTLTDGTPVTSEPATYFFAIEPPAPKAVDDAFAATVGGSLRGNVFTNDTADTQYGSAKVELGTAPTAGTVDLAANGSFTYTPGATFAAGDQFTYTLTDAVGNTATGKVSIAPRSIPTPFGSVFSDGDVDIGIAFEDGEFEPHIHDEVNELEVAPNEGVFNVRPVGLTPRPTSAAFSFIGVPAGSSFYRLSQTPVGGLLFLGFGAEELTTGVFVNDQVTFRIVSVDGPGTVSIWNNTDTGPTVLASATDGITASDTFPLAAGSHTHFNWGFSQRGLYAVTVQFSGTLTSGESVTSEEATYFLAVDPVNAAPSIAAPTKISTPYRTSVPFTGDNAITVVDTDSGIQSLTVTLRAGTGGLIDGQAERTLTGTLTEVNAAIGKLSFTPAVNVTGDVPITVTVVDGGNLIGSENAATTTSTTTVTVGTVPDTVITLTTLTNLAEPGTNGRIRLTRTGGEPSLPLTVSLTVGATATPGADYTALPSSVQFQANQTEVELPITVVDDTDVEAVETIQITIPISANVTVVGSPLTLTITDNDQTVSPPPLPPPPPSTQAKGFSVGHGNNGEVVILNPDFSEKRRVRPFGDDYRGTVRIATADLNSDGVDDLIAGVGPGSTSRVALIDGKTGALIGNVEVYESTFTGGVFVAAGDLTGDGVSDIIVTPDEGGGPVVAVYSMQSGTVIQQSRFFGLNDPAFRGGARAASGDLNGDGRVDLVVSAGFGGGPRVAIFDGQSVLNERVSLIPDFFVFESTLRNGSYPALGDFTGDGRADVVFAAGPGGGPRVRVLDGTELLAGREVSLANFFAGDSTQRKGTRVSTTDVDGNGIVELVVGSASDGSVVVYRLGAGDTQILRDFSGFATDGNGVFVG